MNKLLQVSQRIRPSNPAEGRLGSLELNLWLAQFAGLPFLGLKRETLFQKVWITILGAIVHFLLILYVLFEIQDLYQNRQSLDKMTQNLVLSLTHIVGWLKVFNVYYHYGSLKDIINKLIYLTRTCVLSRKQTDTFYKAEMESKAAMLIYFNLVLLAGSMGFIFLLICEFEDSPFPYTVRLPGYVPAIVQHLYMGLSVALLALEITTIDYLNILLMNQICMHLKVLNLAFDELHVIPEHELKVEPYEWLLSIVKYHSELIVLRQKVEVIFRLPVMLQFVSSMVIVAMTAFQVIVGEGSKSSIIMDLLLCCVLCQLFLYCWFGNEVFEQSKTLSTSGFGCSWHKFNRKCKKTLLIFMINADRPFLFTAGGFMGLTLPSFTFIISKSYSIVAVLRQMYSRT